MLGGPLVEQLTPFTQSSMEIDYVRVYQKVSIYLKRLKGRVFYRPLILIIWKRDT
jgi:hypothetical protein